MGMSMQRSVGGRLGSRAGKRGRSRDPGLMSEINVTPFVDVMLVLLIIFMVTAPLLATGVKVDLPETSSEPIDGQDEPLAVTVAKDGKIFIQETEIQIAELASKLLAITNQKKDSRIFVRGDKAIDYGHMMQVVSKINEAGFNRIALLTENSNQK